MQDNIPSNSTDCARISTTVTAVYEDPIKGAADALKNMNRRVLAHKDSLYNLCTM